MGFFDNDNLHTPTADDRVDGKQKVKSLKLVNDAAEWWIALISEYNDILCNNEKQKQYLHQVVENHRKNFPDSNKSTLLKMSTVCKRNKC